MNTGPENPLRRMVDRETGGTQGNGHRSAPDDSVAYRLYVDPIDGVPPSMLSLSALRCSIEGMVENLIPGYIWQRDPFSLSLHTACEDCSSSTPVSDTKQTYTDTSHAAEPHLYGEVCFGDNIEDEWLVVFLLVEISRRFQDITVHVFDSDGHFLLIEAADDIPEWLSPSNSFARVFLRGGLLHIVPTPSTPAELVVIPVDLSLSEGLAAIRDPSLDTEASAQVQKAISSRLSPYPISILNSHRHVSRCLLPRRAAWVLSHHPSLIAPAIEAFYYRDPVDMRAGRKMSCLLPRATKQTKATPKDLIWTRVAFTRCLYAQAVGQKYSAPTCYPSFPWKEGQPEHLAVDMGVKVAAGLEMLYARGDSLRKRLIKRGEYVSPKEREGGLETVGEDDSDDEADVGDDGKKGETEREETNEEWERFREELMIRGYFSHSSPLSHSPSSSSSSTPSLSSPSSSKVFQDRGARARSFFSRFLYSPSPSTSSLDQNKLPSAVLQVECIESAIAEAEAVGIDTDSVEWRERERVRGVVSEEFASLSPDDSSEWMYLSPPQLEEMLKRYEQKESFEKKSSGNRNSQPPSFPSSSPTPSPSPSTSSGPPLQSRDKVPVPEEDTDSLRHLVEAMNSFLQTETSYEGADVGPLGPLDLLAAREKGDEEEEDASEPVSLSFDRLLAALSPSDPSTSQRDADDTGVGREEREERERENQMEQVMREMDAELASSALGSDFHRKSESDPSCTPSSTSTAEQLSDKKESEREKESEMDPVDLDFNLIKNMLDSYASQEGLSGPASNLFGALGIDLPDNEDGK